MRGTQIVIPKSLQARIIDICHESYFGIVKSKALLRSKVWFPGIDRQMEEKCRDCIPCMAVSQVKTRTPLVRTKMPETVWECVAMDFCGPFPSGEYALVMIDEYSRYPAVDILNSTSANETKLAMEKIFAIYGIP